MPGTRWYEWSGPSRETRKVTFSRTPRALTRFTGSGSSSRDPLRVLTDPGDPTGCFARCGQPGMRINSNEVGAMMKRGTILLFLLAPALPVTAAAQTFSRPVPAPSSTAPSAALAARPDPARVTPYHQSLRMIMVEGGQQREIGSLDDQVVLADDNGRPSLIRVQNLDGPGGQMTDTAV